MAKTNWKFNDVVTEADMNQLGSELNAASEHAAATSGAHGATSAATPSRIIQRDSAGRARVEPPLTGADIARKDTVDNAVQPLIADLIDVPAVALSLAPGVQVVAAPRDTPLRIKSIKGRTLVNLLGCDGNCEDTSRWQAVSSTLALDATNYVSGKNGLKITLSAANGSAVTQSSVTLTASKHYLLAAYLKKGNGINVSAYVSSQAAATRTTFVTTTGFSLAYKKFTGIAVAGLGIVVDVNGANGNYAYADEVRLYEISTSEFASIDSMTPAQIATMYPYVDDIKNVNGVYLRRVAAQPADDQYVFYPDCQLASNVNGSVYDELYTDNIGQERVKREFKTMDLTGDLPWVYLGGDSIQSTAILKIQDSIKDTGVISKFDGKILSRVVQGGSINAADLQVVTDVTDLVNPDVVGITISRSDSGWGVSYVPTADEVKAYFWGWTMRQEGMISTPYTSGTKWWRRTIDNSNPVSTLPISFAPGYTPYRLQYQLTAQVNETVRSEGAIMLAEGANTLEVGYGVIVRERAKPVNRAEGDFVYINSSVALGTGLDRANQSIIEIYRDSRKDKSWTIDNNAEALPGKQRAYKWASTYNPSAVYEVTYLALYTYLIGIPPTQVSAEYAPNQRTVTDDLAKTATQLAGRVTVLENGTAQAKQPQWITPTLLGGWVKYHDNFSGAAYRKVGNEVQLRGMIKDGNNSVAIIKLPALYRPKYLISLPVISFNGTDHDIGSAEVTPAGIVTVYLVGSNWLSLDTIRFAID
ncbi:hypothetical protein [Paenibacillus herberti]|uniref:Uncharacterized protein n=1 Tax=Paenibacillus herberti TaxID=1619309 RepID=A0A229NZP9_9BACL|nr:hypothetical protein [Paenibacillus herberti]OXM15234.1 hypothetical protein CGZ75_00340 [Paenibacillus herberti]